MGHILGGRVGERHVTHGRRLAQLSRPAVHALVRRDRRQRGVELGHVGRRHGRAQRTRRLLQRGQEGRQLGRRVGERGAFCGEQRIVTIAGHPHITAATAAVCVGPISQRHGRGQLLVQQLRTDAGRAAWRRALGHGRPHGWSRHRAASGGAMFRRPRRIGCGHRHLRRRDGRRVAGRLPRPLFTRGTLQTNTAQKTGARANTVRRETVGQRHGAAQGRSATRRASLVVAVTQTQWRTARSRNTRAARRQLPRLHVSGIHHADEAAHRVGSGSWPRHRGGRPCAWHEIAVDVVQGTYR